MNYSPLFTCLIRYRQSSEGLSLGIGAIIRTGVFFLFSYQKVGALSRRHIRFSEFWFVLFVYDDDDGDENFIFYYVKPNILRTTNINTTRLESFHGLFQNFRSCFEHSLSSLSRYTHFMSHPSFIGTHLEFPGMLITPIRAEPYLQIVMSSSGVKKYHILIHATGVLQIRSPKMII